MFSTGLTGFFAKRRDDEGVERGKVMQMRIISFENSAIEKEVTTSECQIATIYFSS